MAEAYARDFEAEYVRSGVVLGEGTFAKVYQATRVATGQEVAWKEMNTFFGSQVLPISVFREVQILSGLDHLHVVSLLDGFLTPTRCVLVFECHPCNLRKFMKNANRRLSPVEVKDFSLQLMHGLAYCHARWVMHRDLQPGCLLISSSHVLKIAGFGLARGFMPMYGQRYTHEVVTLWYRPPEILLGADTYDESVDEWSAGSTIAEMASGKPLSPGDSEIDTCFRIFKKLGTPNETVWRGVSNLPDFKPTFPKWQPRGWRNIRNIHDQMGDSGIDLLENLMRYEPAARISAGNALVHPYFAELLAMSRARLAGA